MFDNMGDKLKGLAITQFVLGLLGSIIAGFIMIKTALFVGLLIIAVGSIASYISCWITYGIGEILDKVSDLEFKIDTIQLINCPTCGHKQKSDRKNCWNCGQPLNQTKE